MSLRIDPYLSLTGSFFLSYLENLAVQKTDSFATKAVKCTVGAVANGVLATAMLTEAVVRGALGIAAKGIHLFLPSSATQGFKEHVVTPLLEGSFANITLSLLLASLVVTNFLGNQIAENFGSNIIDTGEEIIDQFKPFVNYTFFDGSNPSDPLISS